MNYRLITIVLIGLIALSPAVIAKSQVHKQRGLMVAQRASATVSKSTGPLPGRTLSQPDTLGPTVTGKENAINRGEGLKVGLRMEKQTTDRHAGKQRGYLGKSTGINARLTTVGRRRS